MPSAVATNPVRPSARRGVKRGSGGGHGAGCGGSAPPASSGARTPMGAVLSGRHRRQGPAHGASELSSSRRTPRRAPHRNGPPAPDLTGTARSTSKVMPAAAQSGGAALRAEVQPPPVRAEGRAGDLRAGVPHQLDEGRHHAAAVRGDDARSACRRRPRRRRARPPRDTVTLSTPVSGEPGVEVVVVEDLQLRRGRRERPHAVVALGGEVHDAAVVPAALAAVEHRRRRRRGSAAPTARAGREHGHPGQRGRAGQRVTGRPSPPAACPPSASGHADGGEAVEAPVGRCPR